MSVRAVTWAFAQDLPTAPKFVLVALGERANDDGVCWPSVADLVQRTALSERTVQRALAELREKGKVTVEGRNGVLPHYTLAMDEAASEGESADPQPRQRRSVPPSGSRPRHADTGVTVSDTPVMVTPTPVTVSPNPRHGDTRTVKNHQEPSEEPVERARARQLPDDWRPSSAGEAFCREQGLHLRNTFDAFRDYHRAKGSTFKDWDAAWRTWCRNEVKFGAARSSAPGRRRDNPAELLAELDRKRDQPFDFDAPEPRFVTATVLPGRPH